MARKTVKPRSIGETDEPVRYVTVEQLKAVAAAVDEQIRLIWAELVDLRHGKAIEDDATMLEKRLKIK
jgi:hypothetical protein